ncbi:helix-turn-helix domain-containing protein [Nocardiopsis sp. MG754419]|uniref:helix-turn-helix domain-containing protein n=1 Tax=Nocardiopsis sp. MG754419 TaxID=2259865 RepID=UPI001BAA402A|nr:helix-turn-helix domain-containing protein [Nocardiopsis sp. MG754419]MBR8744860.1 DNA-binding protein [Nocardiopsis sp. MG754419]
MAQQYYSVDQVADLLGLHVKTVRAYVREGRLTATRIGKQYRIHRRDLAEFTGGDPAHDHAPSGRPHAEASTVLQVDDVDPTTADRLSTLITAATTGVSAGGAPAQSQVVYDTERGRLRVVLVGGLEETTRMLEFVRALLGEDERPERLT